MRLSKKTSIPVPYVSKGMEPGNHCAATVFHTFHTFHTRQRAPARERAGARTHTRVHACTQVFLSMECMEGMEEGRSTRVFNVHTFATPRKGMEKRRKK